LLGNPYVESHYGKRASAAANFRNIGLGILIDRLS